MAIFRVLCQKHFIFFTFQVQNILETPQFLTSRYHVTVDHDFALSKGKVGGEMWCKSRRRHSSESQSWAKINDKRAAETHYRYDGDFRLKIGYKDSELQSSRCIEYTVYNLWRTVLEKVPESYRPKSIQLKSVENLNPPIDQCLAGFDILKNMPPFVQYQSTPVKNPKFFWSSLSYLTDNGNEYS